MSGTLHAVHLMFESVTRSPKRGEGSFRIAAWAALGGSVLVVVSLIVAQAKSPLLVFAVVGLLVWLPLFFLLYRLSAQIKDESNRLLTQSVICAVFWTPSLVIGHGVAPAPAIVVVFLPEHFFVGAISLFVGGVIALVLLGRRTTPPSRTIPS